MRKITSPTPLSRRFVRFVATATRKISACILPTALLAVAPILSSSTSGPSKSGGSLSDLDGHGTEPLGEVQLYCGACVDLTRYVPEARHFAISDTEGRSWGGHHGPSVGEPGAVPDGYHFTWLQKTCLLHGCCGYAAAEIEPSALTDMIAEAVTSGDVAMLTRLAGMPGVAVNSSRDAFQRAATDQLSTGS